MKWIPVQRGPMKFPSSSQLGAHLKIVIAVAMLWMKIIPRGRALSIETPSSLFQCPTGFFSFGTSLGDTGSGPFSLPGLFASENPPYGNTFFGRNALRFSDGRLVVDFLALASGYPLLTGYLQSIAPDFRYGVNFAVSGATAIAEAPSVPFHLDFQVAQFSRFKLFAQAAKQDPGSVKPCKGVDRDLSIDYFLQRISFRAVDITNARPRGLAGAAYGVLCYDMSTGIPSQYKSSLPENVIFTKGLYILSFGRNDLTSAYTLDRLTPSRAIATIVPRIVQSISRGIQRLYDDGARIFLNFNVPPQGCSPQYLTNFGPVSSKADYDEYGCLAPYNEVIQVLNRQIHSAIQELRMTLNDSLILDFDYYQAYIAVLDNPQSFGFANTLDACCGVGGQHNYDSSVQCSRTGILNNVSVLAESCNNPSEYISWDGVHYTDAFNRVIAELLLTGKFLDPPINMTIECKLDFSKFTGANFTQAYPDGYIVGPPNLYVDAFNNQPYLRF